MNKIKYPVKFDDKNRTKSLLSYLLEFEDIYFLKGIYFIEELDGCFNNIVCLKGLDIIVEKNNFKKLKQFLLNNGFILFLSSEKNLNYYYFINRFLKFSIIVHLKESNNNYINKIVKNLYSEFISVNYNYYSIKILKPEFLITYLLLFIYINNELDYEHYLEEVKKIINLYERFINWDKITRYIIENSLTVLFLKLFTLNKEVTKYIPKSVIENLKKKDTLFIDKIKYRFLL